MYISTFLFNWTSFHFQVLKKMFQSPHIYATKEFRDQFEAQSRSNMVAEIKRLERQWLRADQGQRAFNTVRAA